MPTYVEAGAADLGITGKDVLAEQSERDVYELLDLGFGPCRMVFATVAGEDRAAEALRRLGVMRVATKYPRIAAAYFERTGRQAEIVEVKGSVELAPLTGLVQGIVDLTATGTTLRENGLVDARGDRRLDRAADRQPGRPQAQGGRDRRRAWRGSVRLECTRRERRRGRGAGAPRRAGGGIGGRRRRRDRRGRRAAAATPRVLEYEERFGGGGALRVAQEELDAALAGAGRGRARRAGGRDRERARGRRGGAGRRGRASTLPRGPDGPAARGAGRAARRSTLPAGRNPYPSTVVMGAVTARAGGRRRGGASPRPASTR